VEGDADDRTDVLPWTTAGRLAQATFSRRPSLVRVGVEFGILSRKGLARPGVRFRSAQIAHPDSRGWRLRNRFRGAQVAEAN
jgi:hypothetical protein